MPYMAQLLGLRLIQSASARGSTDVSDEDFDAAIARMVADANPKIVATYASLTERARDPEMVHTLRSVATAPQDQWGRIEVMAAAEGRVSGRRPTFAGRVLGQAGRFGRSRPGHRQLRALCLLRTQPDGITCCCSQPKTSAAASRVDSADRQAERQDRTIQDRSNSDRLPIVLRPLASNA